MSDGGGHIKTLLIEDNPDDALLMQEELAASKWVSFDVEWVERLSEGLDRLAQGRTDIVLLDLGLPDSSGADTCHRVHAAAPRVPIVVLTGLNNEALGVQLLKEGAQDYLIKGDVQSNLLVRSILYAIERHRLRTELQLAKDSAEARLRVVVDNTPIILFALNNSGMFTLVEGNGLETLGHKPSEMLGRSIFDVYRGVPGLEESVRAALDGEPRSLVMDVSKITLDAWYQPLFDYDGKVVGVVGVAHDISERRRLEEELRQSQKMEAIGQLAGGIAHDFNNLLSAILGYAQLGMMRASQDDRVCAYLPETEKAAKRAAHLTRQLLAFSRRQTVESKPLSLDELVRGLDMMLRRVIGADIELVILPSREIGYVEVDPGQMEQVLINLVINACDAMPEGGKLIIETANITLDEKHAAPYPEIAPGEYATLAIGDTGTGMTADVQSHAFEPFFTTKEVGKGTGLGLSTCYGIVSQFGGQITIDSVLGQGTKMKVYLPRVLGAMCPTPSSDDLGHLPPGNETVLLVDDEPLVRGLASSVLGEQGYDVLEAANGHEAMRHARKYAEGKLDLLLTDVVMPLMGGKELAEQLREIHPNVKVLFISGYADDPVGRFGLSEGEADFMQKPFEVATLVSKTREVLDRR